MQHGGGQALYDEMYGRFNLKPFLCGNSGPQWAGWFRNEINSVDDLKGLKFRTTGSCVRNGDQARHGRTKPWAARLCSRHFRLAPLMLASSSARGRTPRSVTTRSPRITIGLGVGEPSSAEECAVNLDAYNELPDDLKEVVTQACSSLYNDVLTEYNTKHAQALTGLVNDHGVMVRKLPDDVIVAMGNAAGEVIADLRADSDDLVKQITESFLGYRKLMREYMPYADNGQMNARLLDYKYD
jgi:TRAP-type mannitol/chloroaromatic compound transport system substrate-binding protein